MASSSVWHAHFTLEGLWSLLMHKDDVETSDLLEVWRKDPQHKNVSKAGDDRYPAWTWMTYVYHDGQQLTLPATCLLAALRVAGARKILSKNRTFKEATQAGLFIAQEHLAFTVLRPAGSSDKNSQDVLTYQPIRWAELQAIRALSFAEQKAACEPLGFSLDVRRARIGTSKHVRVRPKFRHWRVTGSIQVQVPEISFPILQELFGLAGSIGLGDWRPGGKTPGPYGMFKSVLVKAGDGPLPLSPEASLRNGRTKELAVA